MVTVASPEQPRHDVADGTLAGGVIAFPVHHTLGDLLIPMVSPGATHTPGFKVVDRADELVGEETAQAVAAGLASRLYADRIGTARASALAPLDVVTAPSATAARRSSTTSAPPSPSSSSSSAAAWACARSCSSAARAPWCGWRPPRSRPRAIVDGKMLAVGVTGLASIFVVWGATTLVFGADWGDPLGVLLMCLGSVAAMWASACW